MLLNEEINEKFLSFIWKHKLFNFNNLKTVSGEKLQIINSGFLNHNSGADFSQAKVIIGEIEWNGDVEIHVRTSDWHKHKHEKNPAYENVILHVVYINDIIDNALPPCLALKDIINQEYINRYSDFINHNNDTLLCKSYIHQIPEYEIKIWQQRMLIERIESKIGFYDDKLKKEKGDLLQTGFKMLCYSFGFNTNNSSFELLAERINYQHLIKLKDNPISIEAYLFGVSGFLSHIKKDDPYISALKKEFNFLKQKYDLKEIPFASWKFSKMRPMNFPTIRVFQLSQLLINSENFIDTILTINSVDDFKKLVKRIHHPFWDFHYHFEDDIHPKKVKVLGNQSLNIIMINFVVPFIYLYGITIEVEEFKEKALHLLSQLPKENNKITRIYEHTPFENNTAEESQSLIHLHKNYCVNKKCLDCRIGIKIIAN